MGATIGVALVGNKFLEGASRQPEMMGALQPKLFVIAGLVDAIFIISVAVGLFGVCEPAAGRYQVILAGLVPQQFGEKQTPGYQCILTGSGDHIPPSVLVYHEVCLASADHRTGRARQAYR